MTVGQTTTPFSRGVNLTGWFQAGSVRQVQVTKYTFEDFQQIQSLGCDVIRLPINLHFMTSGAPDYQVDPLLFTFLDQPVAWAEQLGLHLILDNHTFDPNTNTDPNVGSILAKVWKQVAEHYKDGPANLYYEILNEPHGISDALWGSIQGRVIDSIRTVDTTHTLIVGGSGYNGYNNLAPLPVYPDDKLIYTFHFYDPFIFTHQGAGWVQPSMEPLAGVPFPHDPARMPPVPPSLAGSWIASGMQNYGVDGTIQKVQQLIDIADQFRQSRQVPVFCGELGVYIPNSPAADRVAWYQVVRTYLESKNIAWTTWDYHGGFGLFEPGGNDLFNHDLNLPLIQALGLTVPLQTPYLQLPDTEGRVIYDDYLGPGIVESSFGGGLLDYYSPDQPNQGEFVIRWQGPMQYETIGLDFVPNRDFSQLVAQGYALDLMIRSDRPGTSFDIRFLDTKTTDPNDHPWRMRVTVNESLATWDRRWQAVRVPLSSFVEHGSWDNNTWHQPEGKFDWSDVDRLEIVAEQLSLNDGTIWLDQIVLSNQDTSAVRDTSAFSTALDPGQEALSIWAFPNPADEFLTLETDSPELLRLQVMDGLGRVIVDTELRTHLVLPVATWPSGLYVLRVTGAGQRSWSRKIWRQGDN